MLAAFLSRLRIAALPAITVNEPAAIPIAAVVTSVAPELAATEPTVKPSVIPIAATTIPNALPTLEINPVTTVAAQAIDVNTPAIPKRSIRSPILVNLISLLEWTDVVSDKPVFIRNCMKRRIFTRDPSSPRSRLLSKL